MGRCELLSGMKGLMWKLNTSCKKKIILSITQLCKI